MKLNRLVKTLILSFVVTVITLATSMLFKEMKEDCYIEYNVDISSDNLELDLLPDDNIMEETDMFKDVDISRWSYGDIEWAANIGIVNGFEDGTFRPTESVTREQICVMLRRLYNLIREEDNNV